MQHLALNDQSIYINSYLVRLFWITCTNNIHWNKPNKKETLIALYIYFFKQMIVYKNVKIILLKYHRKNQKNANCQNKYFWWKYVHLNSIKNEKLQLKTYVNRFGVINKKKFFLFRIINAFLKVTNTEE